ncbi:hypothetical protein DPMN_051465 [Dreissena polymorpha]|uniref:Uncharacterized protein n=1 Tax=Dreissena polymorpha TaxID=45954 RepID=A0A9D4CJH2_DREPO|nr:hypothetical protein DPMN_051465 [Dreissena polymorpha]
MVTKCLSTNKATVNFMVPCRKPGNFMWPAGKDVQEVEKQFVLRKGLLPECMNSERQWFFKDYIELNELYNKYKECFST